LNSPVIAQRVAKVLIEKPDKNLALLLRDVPRERRCVILKIQLPLIWLTVSPPAARLNWIRHTLQPTGSIRS